MQNVRLFTLLTTILLISLVLIPASASTLVVARGGSLEFYGNDAPMAPGSADNSTEPFRTWIFGNIDSMYGFESTTNGEHYIVRVPAGPVMLLEPGTYAMYVQFPGVNHQFDIIYTNYTRGFNSTVGTIYRTIPDSEVNGYAPRMIQEKFDQYSTTKPVDDIILRHTIVVEDPSMKVRNMYNKIDGSMHLDIDTNLNAGETVTAIIDEEIYGKSEYAKMMTSTDTVLGSDNRSFKLDFKREAASQLPAGKTHVISIHFFDGGVTTIPFKTFERYVEPTPTKVIEHYYDFSGELIGYDINTTTPAESTPVPTPTAEIKYDTILADERIDFNNRSIPQRGKVYIGEKNLDMVGALGWQSWHDNDYVFSVQYCEYTEMADESDADVEFISTPQHFYVDPALFKDRYGAWCQHQVGLYEEHPPVAFFVLPQKQRYNLTTEVTPEVIYVNSSPVNWSAVDFNIGNVSNPATTGTLPWEPVTTESTPIPIPTTDTIVVPLPWWIAVAAVLVVVMKR